MKQLEYFGGYKQAHRKEDDIAIVNAGMRVSFEEDTNKVCYFIFHFLPENIDKKV